MMKTNYGLDWFRYTAHGMSDGSRMVPEHALFENVRPRKPAPFYEFAVELVAGRHDWVAGENMPDMLTFSGQDLIQIKRHALEYTLLRHALSLQRVNVTRLDFAIDVVDGFSPQEFQDRFERGEIQSSAKKITVIESREEGSSLGKTVYLGSRKSERFLRVYDKGLETGKGGSWTRIEIELKQGVATAVARAMVREGIRSVGCAVVSRFANAPAWKQWQDALSTQSDVDITIGRKETNHEKWLREVVFPNFERAVENGNPEALRLLEAWYKQMVARTASA